jgi:hypothetical protein
MHNQTSIQVECVLFQGLKSACPQQQWQDQKKSYRVSGLAGKNRTHV